MPFRFFISFCVLLFSFHLCGQTEYSYEGYIKLSNINLYTYKVTFIEDNGVIKGYSITDFEGDFETKSLISGTIDHETQKIRFHESEIVTTKSPLKNGGFCYIHFNGKIFNQEGKQIVEGKFNSVYKGGADCIFGWVDLTSTGPKLTIRKKKKPKKKPIKTPKKIVKAKVQVKPVKVVPKPEPIVEERDELIAMLNKASASSINSLNDGDVLHIFSQEDELSILLYDEDQQDNDRIDFYIDGEYRLQNFMVTRRSKKIVIDMKGKNRVEVRVKALNNGIIGKNTIRLDITDSKNLTRTLTNFMAGDEGTLVFVKQ
ncbi:MAG: hypothetical protein K0U54_07060 [Bacteroidetes bacterium]|nr:hypothetical protein [Bacteroidota bacterium]